jgi:hypothetical protein
LSQALSEGDGISVLVHVDDAAGAVRAESQGAEGIVLEHAAKGIGEQGSLPILYLGGSPESALAAGADAWLLIAQLHDEEDSELEERYEQTLGLGLECVVSVREEEELELVLERLDPEIVLLSPGGDHGGDEVLDRVLELLPDVPAGKLAIADLGRATREEVAALERAGVDAVLVRTGDVTHLVGGPSLDV